MIAKGSGYVRGNRQAARARLRSHFKYIEHRSREIALESRDDRRIFSKDNNVVNRRDAVKEVMDHTSTSVNYHKIVLSPSDEEPVNDWREWIRQVMHDLEEAQGKELHWFAVHHQNTEHPHVHVVVAGAGSNQETGREEPVKLYTKDYDQLRESGREHSDFHFHQLLEKEFHCCLSNFGSFFPLHNFSSNRPRAACGADKHHPLSGEFCRITFPCLYFPFSWSQYRTRETETGHFLPHNFSFLAVHGVS